jgi:hypothetical protein
MPSFVGCERMSNRPFFRPWNFEIKQEFHLSWGVPGKNGRYFHESYRTNSQPISSFSIEQSCRPLMKIGVRFSDVDQQARIDNPSHYLSPARISCIQLSVVRGSLRKRRAKPTIAFAPSGFFPGIDRASRTLSQPSNSLARSSSRPFTFSMAASTALIAKLYHGLVIRSKAALFRLFAHVPIT